MEKKRFDWKSGVIFGRDDRLGVLVVGEMCSISMKTLSSNSQWVGLFPDELPELIALLQDVCRYMEEQGD